MADINTVFNAISSGSSVAGKWLIIAGAIIIGFMIVGAILVWYYFAKKRYTLRVEVKIPRSDGRIILGEWARGYFNVKRGALIIKRDKKPAVPCKIIDIRRYLQGEDLVCVMMVAPEDFRPILNESWTEHVVEYEDQNGNIIQQKESVMNIKVDTGLNKPWKSSWDAASKRAYSLVSFIQQFQTPIAVAIVIIACFVGFAIIWTRLPSVCG